jgi:hypothetical protein
MYSPQQPLLAIVRRGRDNQSEMLVAGEMHDGVRLSDRIDLGLLVRVAAVELLIRRSPVPSRLIPLRFLSATLTCIKVEVSDLGQKTP